MRYEDISRLADILGAHIERSAYTLAARAGVHSRLFKRLEAGLGCRVDTYSRALTWFSDNWPADLEWPRDIPRPPKPKKETA
jgi:hypothetical protein